MLGRPAMETQRVEACGGLNRNTGGGGLAFRSAANDVFINVYEHNGDFNSRWQLGLFPIGSKAGLAIQQHRSNEAAQCRLFQSAYYPLQTSRNQFVIISA